MSRKWFWLAYALLAWQFAKTTVSAFSVPWSWALDQLLFVFYVLCGAIVLGFWAFTWQRGGTEAVKARWAQRQQRMAAPLNKKAFRWSLVFWITVAIVLVIIFNVMQR
jgi:hypothetical protein